MKIKFSFSTIAILIFLLPMILSGIVTINSCAIHSRGIVISPQAIIDHPDWTEEEKKQEIALRPIRTTSEAGYYLLRLNESEKPHVHDHHDITVILLSGQALMHYEGKSHLVNPGDIIEVPRGVVHWAENLNNQPCEAYAIFTPPFDEKDKRLVGSDLKG